MKTWIAKIKDSGPWIVFFEIFVIAQLLLIFVFNLTHLKYEAGFDSSAAMAQAMEIWNQKSIFLKHWDYQSTLGLDSVIIPASIFYGITHNIFLAYGIADCLGVLLYDCLCTSADTVFFGTARIYADDVYGCRLLHH